MNTVEMLKILNDKTNIKVEIYKFGKILLRVIYKTSGHVVCVGSQQSLVATVEKWETVGLPKIIAHGFVLTETARQGN